MKPALFVSLALLALAPRPVQAQKEAIIIFKDGFLLEGKVQEKRDYITDPASGKSFTIPKGGAFMYLDDEVRRIFFTPSQVQEVIPRKPEERKELMVIQRTASRGQGLPLGASWELEMGNWDNKLERYIKVTKPMGGEPFSMRQRIVHFSPHHLFLQTVNYNWEAYYLTKEMALEEVSKLLFLHYGSKPDLKTPVEKRLPVAKFLHQAGWHEAADQQLISLVTEFPDAKKAVEPLQVAIHKVQADRLAEELLNAHKVGQPQRAQELLERYEKENLSALVHEKNLLAVQDLKNKRGDGAAKLQLTTTLLKKLPALIPGTAGKIWLGMAEAILLELNLDTMPRLDTFVTFAQQHLRERDEKRKPTQSTEEVLSLAVTGWVQDNAGAEPDVKSARNLWHARQAVLEYLKNEDAAQRTQILTSLLREYPVPPDVLARLIKLLPPVEPHDAITAEPQKLEIKLPDSEGGSYWIQLPPDYHHQRPYPVMVALHSARDKAEAMLPRFTEHAAKHGIILVAPNWAKSGKGLARANYNFSDSEHIYILDCLRDVRRRFNVDSDRVFLWGWELGGDMAFDIGLAHPDQFAGVMPFSGRPRHFCGRYWPNGQYLPFYVVEGEKNGISPKTNREFFQDWIRSHYPCFYVEYKGRSADWFFSEVATAFDWLSRKKRHLPTKELGRHNPGLGAGEEFMTMRHGDNRFYFVGIDGINQRHINDARNFATNVIPATVQANVVVGNETTIKAGMKVANVWTQINLRVKGAKQATVYLSPAQHDFTRPLQLRVNGNPGPTRMVEPSLTTMLEELYRTGDRQRLIYAKITVGL